MLTSMAVAGVVFTFDAWARAVEGHSNGAVINRAAAAKE
ncbi:hypothetical protein SynPROSU1_02326 [Synechococcus sp. PROS-U-1]|nr:hypothetical protein SynPROSU1_02326 [Synechococcus sp. PROS-U-1]